MHSIVPQAGYTKSNLHTIYGIHRGQYEQEGETAQEQKEEHASKSGCCQVAQYGLYTRTLQYIPYCIYKAWHSTLLGCNHAGHY